MAETKERVYEVTGDLPIVWEEVRYEKGDQFQAEMPPEQEKFLLELKHIKRVTSPTTLPVTDAEPHPAPLVTAKADEKHATKKGK